MQHPTDQQGRHHMTRNDTQTWQDLFEVVTFPSALNRADRIAAWARVASRDGTPVHQPVTEPALSLAVSRNR